jgi:hypothetical protein
MAGVPPEVVSLKSRRRPWQAEWLPTLPGPDGTTATIVRCEGSDDRWRWHFARAIRPPGGPHMRQNGGQYPRSPSCEQAAAAFVRATPCRRATPEPTPSVGGGHGCPHGLSQRWRGRPCPAARPPMLMAALAVHPCERFCVHHPLDRGEVHGNIGRTNESPPGTGAPRNSEIDGGRQRGRSTSPCGTIRGRRQHRPRSTGASYLIVRR